MEKWRVERVKQILKDYPDTDKYIKKIEESIRTPYKQTDVNGDIKGTRMDNDPNFATMWTIETHKQIASFRRNKQIIDDLLYQCGADTETIIRELYIKKFPQYTMQGLVDNFMVSCGKTKAFEKRNRFFEQVDRMLEI